MFHWTFHYNFKILNLGFRIQSKVTPNILRILNCAFFGFFFCSVEIIDLEEILDYELDVEMDEDDLLGSEEELCGEFWLFNLKYELGEYCLKALKAIHFVNKRESFCAFFVRKECRASSLFWYVIKR